VEYCLIYLEIVKRPKNEIITSKSYLKQDNVVWGWGAKFELDFDVKLPLLRLL
jgi:hypothetical protein